MGTTAFSTQMDRTAAVHTDLIFTGLRQDYFSESPVRGHFLLEGAKKKILFFFQDKGPLISIHAGYDQGKEPWKQSLNHNTLTFLRIIRPP